LIAGAIAVAVAAPQAHAARTSCARVEVHKRDGSSTQGVGARSIRASGTTCNEARHIARVAAKAALDKGENHLPATIDGFRIKIKVGCATCSPVWPVTATKTGAKVTFTLHGGD
jgi:hypothetical protein